MKVFRVLIVVVFCLVFVSKIFAHGDGGCGGKCSRRCADALGKLTLPRIELYDSGRDGDMTARQLEAAKIIYQDIAQKLGLKIPDMVIKSLTATDMAAMTANAGHPAPHALDGAAVIENSQRSGNILEFVETGRDSHVQFLRDRNTFEETLIVFSHVVGHYDFAGTSYLFEMRDGDRIRDSYELATLMTKLYHTHDYEQVDRFYQYLKTAAHMQDMARSSFAMPSTFIQEKLTGQSQYDPIADPLSPAAGVIRPENEKHPKTPSTHILQAMVHNLAPNAPDYQREMLKVFERLHRVGPAIMATKIMNEGWATLMEYMILSHSPWADGSNILEFASINSGVNVPGFSNPYWLGLQAWMRIRERFMDRADVKTLSRLEADKAFIKFCREEIIRKHTDYSFLRYALDEAWVEKWNLLIYREAGEADGVPPKQKNLSISKDYRRIVNFIANRYANMDWKVPQVEIVDFDYQNSGAILLRHKSVGGVPLEKDSLAKSLYVLSQIFKRPIVMEAVGTNFWSVPQMSDRVRQMYQLRGIPIPEQNADYTYKYKIKVSPNGSVDVDFDKEDKQIIGAEKLQAEFANSIANYRADIGITYASPADEGPKFRDLVTKISNESLGGSAAVNVLGHAPTAAQAVFKYHQLVERRMTEILKRVVSGNWPMRQTADGKNVMIRVLPEVPEFQIDFRVYSKKMKGRQPTPAEGRWDSNLSSFSLLRRSDEATEKSSSTFFPDEDLDIGSGPYQPGDMWDIPPKGKGKGQGEAEEGEGEEEEGEGDQGGNGNGEGSEDDPSFIKVPIELIGELIAEQLELKNVRRTEGGENPIESERRAAAASRPSGHVREDRTFEKILEKGIALAVGKGLNPQEMTVEELYLVGLEQFEPEDIVVYDRETVMIPDMDAVIIYVADTSGSMGKEHRMIERRAVALIRAVLKTRYPHLKEKFVIYDTEAKEVTREEFFTRNLGGGTETAAGLDVVDKLLEKFPPAQYNRYIQLFSDGGDFNVDKAIAKAKELAELVEFFAYGHVSPDPIPMDWAPLSSAFKQLASQNGDKLGYADLTRDQRTLIEALKAYYAKRPQQ